MLLCETTCEAGDERWRGDAAYVERVVDGLAADGVLRPDEVVDVHHQRYRDAYPVFDLGFEGRRAAVLDHLGGIENLETAGLQGRFAYMNMHSAMRQGADAAEEILRRLEGRRPAVRDAG